MHSDDRKAVKTAVQPAKTDIQMQQLEDTDSLISLGPPECGCGMSECCTGWMHSSMLLQRALRHSSKQRINLALWRPPLLPLIAPLNEDSV